MELILFPYGSDGSKAHEALERAEPCTGVLMRHDVRQSVLFQFKQNLLSYLTELGKVHGRGTPSTLDELATECQIVITFGAPPNYRLAAFSGMGLQGLQDLLKFLHSFTAWKRSKMGQTTGSLPVTLWSRDLLNQGMLSQWPTWDAHLESGDHPSLTIADLPAPTPSKQHLQVKIIMVSPERMEVRLLGNTWPLRQCLASFDGETGEDGAYVRKVAMPIGGTTMDEELAAVAAAVQGAFYLLEIDSTVPPDVRCRVGQLL